MIFFAKAVAVFVAATALDFACARYNIAVGDRQAALAGVYSVGILFFSGLNVIGYTHEPLLLVPALMGTFVGTWFAVRTSKT